MVERGDLLGLPLPWRAANEGRGTSGAPRYSTFAEALGAKLIPLETQKEASAWVSTCKARHVKEWVSWCFEMVRWRWTCVGQILGWVLDGFWGLFKLNYAVSLLERLLLEWINFWSKHFVIKRRSCFVGRWFLHQVFNQRGFFTKINVGSVGFGFLNPILDQSWLWLIFYWFVAMERFLSRL